MKLQKPFLPLVCVTNLIPFMGEVIFDNFYKGVSGMLRHECWVAQIKTWAICYKYSDLKEKRSCKTPGVKAPRWGLIWEGPSRSRLK